MAFYAPLTWWLILSGHHVIAASHSTWWTANIESELCVELKPEAGCFTWSDDLFCPSGSTSAGIKIHFIKIIHLVSQNCAYHAEYTFSICQTSLKSLKSDWRRCSTHQHHGAHLALSVSPVDSMLVFPCLPLITCWDRRVCRWEGRRNG